MNNIVEKSNALRIVIAYIVLLITIFVTAIYTKTDIPYANVILCASFWLITLFSFLRMKISARGKLTVFIAALTVGIVTWYVLSYTSYYGVRRTVDSIARDMYYNVKTALSLNLPEKEKMEMLKQCMSGKSSRREQITLFKNGEKIYEVKFKDGVTEQYISEKLYLKEKNGESVPFYPIQIGDDIFEFSYEYANKPYLLLGIIRTVSFSATDSVSNEHYITRRNYERSIYFALFFIFASFAMYQFLLKEQVNKKQAATLLELTNFKLTYDKIQQNFKREVIDSQNFLQPMQSSWDKEEKMTAQSARYDALNKMAAQSARHDVLNEIENLRAAGLPENNRFKMLDANDFSKYQERLSKYKTAISNLSDNNFDIVACTYDFLIAPWISTIRTSLKKLDEILDIKREVYPVAKVIEHLTSSKAIPKAVLEGKANSVININILGNINTEARVNIVMSKLESIVFNLISNSTQAVSNYKQKLRKEKSELRKTYKGVVSLKIYQLKRNEKLCLCIEISDNAGGFSEEILNDIYKKPLPSSKEAGRTGEGTSYIGYFVKLMDGEIEADNILLNDGSKGARTRVYIVCEG